jgi:hypothetical protein
MGLYKLKVQINYGPQRFCKKERKINWWNIRREKEDLLSFKKEKLCKGDI